MEDGDDDTSLTADGQKWKEDQGSSENNILVPKDEYEEVCSDEKYVVSSTSQNDDNPLLASSQLHDKEDISDQESENKTSNSDLKLLDNSSEFVDSSDELHNVAQESSPVSVGGEQPAAPEENNGILLREESSEPCEDRNVQVVSREEENVISSMGEAENVHSSVGEERNPLSSTEETENVHSSVCEEGNALSSMDETENVHSSVGEEEEAVEEEEEEEEEQELQTSVSSDEVISKLPEENLQQSYENFKKSDHSNKEHEDQYLTEENEEAIEENTSEPLDNFDPASDLDVCSDLQHENREVESSLEEERDVSEKVDKSDHENEDFEENCSIESESEKLFKEECAQSVDYHDECISPDEKDSVMEDCVSDTTDQIEKCDEIASKEDEKLLVDSVESCSRLEINAKQMLIGETEHSNSPLHNVEDEQLEQGDKNEITQSFENCVSRAEENMLGNSALSVECDRDAVKFTENENLDKMSEQEDELCSTHEREAISSPVSEGRDMSCENGALSVQIPIEREKPEQSVELEEDEMNIDEITEQDSEMHEIEMPVKSPEFDNAAFEKASSPIPRFQEPSLVTPEACNENIVNESLNESKSGEKVEDVDVSLKVNGEVELTTNNLLNDKESSAPAKEKVSLKRKLHCSSSQGILCDVSPPESVKGNVRIKSFKKRLIAQVSDVSSKETPDVSTSVQEELRVKNKRSGKKLILETPQVLVSHQPLPDGSQANTPLTEYAQYLGLQPTVKFKCYNCGESGFPSMLKLQEHQNICLKNVRIHTYTKPPPSPIVEPAPSTNFRITRKVYLCSACGTYYENWNLFLHMREVHKRHICLFCLLMFSQADKLAQHLSGKHGIADSSYSSPEQFLHEFKGSFFVMCCTCEQMFSERDDFFDHLCKDTSVINTDQACTLCGLKGAHFPTCRRAFTDSNSLSSPAQSNQQSAVVSSNTDSSQNSQSSSQEKPGSTSKYSLQNDKPTSGRKSQYKLSEQNVERSDKNHNTGDVDEDYDISDAASYCHVNIHEPDKQKQEISEGKVVKDTVIDDINIDAERINHEVQSNEENKNVDTDGTVGNESANNLENHTVNKEDFVSQNESQSSVEKPLPHPTETAQEEDEEGGEEEDTTEMEVDEVLESQPPLSPNTDDTKQIDTCRETQLINQSKLPNDGDTESDTSASGADSHDSDGSSSSSEASSDENEQEEKEPLKEDVKSEDSDLEKSDSDKMSIVVDEARSEDDLDKQENVNDDLNNSNITESETNEINEHKNDSPVNSDFKVIDKSTNNTDLGEEQQDNIQIAGDDVPLLELTLEETLDALPIQTVVKECVKISCSTCVYCNHAKKIAVNGKQLVLHLLAEHRFEPVVCSDSGELTPIFGFVDNLKAKLSELQDMYFNTDSYDSADKNFTRPYDRTYECFHCHFITTLHKELYVHNRKMHQKTILLCIMCKSNFYSYSELLCHLCPGIYVPDSNILFRCCLCVVDGLPSAFRLMVHLRKRHHACDVCLETTGDQQKLSNHVWKHKLHHLCYRCGIAYRNKPDITKHLFWKHGTESVLCKKCLQKKWPHVYHFCIPPTAFLCEECNASFSRAVALKVHKRLHVGDISYQCDECDEKFISKKLLRRHKEKHRQVVVEKEDYKRNENIADDEMQELEHNEVKSRTPIVENDDIDKDVKEDGSDCAAEKTNAIPDNEKDTEIPQEISREPEEIESSKPDEIKDNKKSKVVDVYDLPPLNLSSESDDSDEEQMTKQPSKDVEPDDSPPMAVNESVGETNKSHEGEQPTEEEVQPVLVVDGVWDNFKTYKANLEKREIMQAQASESLKASSSTSVADGAENHSIVDIVMADHDYCVLPEKPNEDSHLTEDCIQIEPSQNTDVSEKENAENLDDKTVGADHNYCFNTSPHPEDKNDPPSSLPQIPSNLTVQSPSLPLPHPSLPLSPAQPPPPPPPPPTPPNPIVSSPKKKQKSPKKKQKQSGSSSSSDSSSNSDSSSCTCGTNCSCTSNSSSSSSGSSSTSSDSDSSSSEGRRRQAARRERRRERAKRKLETGSKGGTPPPAAGLSTPGVETGGGSGNRAVEVTPTPLQIDSSGAGSLQVDDTPIMTAPEPEDNDFLIRESDLDTTETETDEDFYDKYPQKQANKLLAEKRNQLLLLAAVAPVNNGTIAQPSPPPTTETQEPTQKKKVKTKRHKKSQHNSSEKKESKLKLNIPAAYYNSPSFSVGNVRHSVSPLPNSHSTSHISRLPLDTYSPANPEASSTPTAYHSTGSGSENESKRLSKRKRIPKKFYGDSSEEEAEHAPQQPFKWRKVTPASNSTPVAQPIVPSGFTYRAVSVPPPEPVHVQSFPLPEKSDEEDGDESDSGHEAKRSSSESSNSDSDNEQTDADSDVETVPTVTNVVSSVSGNTTQQKNENLYCYCQCPYDEVSEMIACDGKDCSIEWFHFECVGIMVPPKGKWFCPDCRKKTAAKSEYLLHA